jgi:small subunit ribosomal protein S1
LIHISEITTARIEKPEDLVKVGDTLKAEILTIDKEARKIGLSSKLVTLRNERGDVDEYIKKAKSTSKTSLGELFGETLKNATNPTSSSGES